jgi:hypothetical protein
VTDRQCGSEECAEPATVTGRRVGLWNHGADCDAGYCRPCADVLVAADLFVPARPVEEVRR